MAHNYMNKIDDMIKSNKLYRFNNELTDTKDDIRIKQIKNIIQQYEENINLIKTNDTKIKEHIDVLRNSQYNKRWQDLKEEQKINRIEKYINDNNINLEQKDIDRLKEYSINKILKSNNVIYNRYNGFITDITIIKKVNDIYELDEKSEEKKKQRKKQVVKKT